TTSSTPGLLAETLKEEIPEIEYAATSTWVNEYTLSIKEKSIKYHGNFVGSDFFNLFSYELIEGNKDQLLIDKNSIVISESVAKSFFGESQNLIGRMIEWQHSKPYQITGVFKDIPLKSSVKFDFVLPFETYKETNKWVLNWGNNSPQTYIKLIEGASAPEVAKKIKNFIKDRNEESSVELFLQQYETRYLYGRYEDGVQSGGRIEYVQLFSVIALFVLVIACINFMNLSTAKATRRGKEIGIKKSLGINKGLLIFQFLTESIVISIASLAIAVIIVWLFLPEFNSITGKNIELKFTLDLILTALIIGIGTGILAGSYPAFYMSGFNPVKVLKGQLHGSFGEILARKGLVIFQFFLSTIMIVGVLIVYNQIKFAQSKNLGYNKDNILKFTVEGDITKSMDSFINGMNEIPGVKGASSIGHSLLGRNNNTSGLEWPGKEDEQLILFENVAVNIGLLELLEVELKEGRFFSAENANDSTKVIFNEAAIEVMNLKNPIGTTVKLWNEYDLEIIGVVKNFNFQSIHEEVKPLFFIYKPDWTWVIMTKIESGKEKETLGNIEDYYTKRNPGFPFDYSFQDQDYNRLYASEQRIADLSKYFAGFGILISSLGLFGLATYMSERRIKEIGIRKALGASVSGIVLLLSKEFSKLVFISILFSIPLSYYMAKKWLDGFAYRVELSIWYFIGAGVIALLIAWITVGSQALKAAKVNPSSCLKDD
ncbi:MAG: ABC transporter permease, partial [Cyclobacteriaceae bacterium]|nr:ABC transporter permease [Cyclobacteriaceae bacterium]